MYLERLLQINIATMAALGTLLLGMGQRNDVLPLAMFIAATASVWLTDITGWFRLNRPVTNLAAVVAVLIFFRQLSELRGVEQVLAIGNFLAYLQIILLFQKKEPRTYGCLALLSLVQVVVAAALDQQVWFGLLLVVYLFVGLSALPLLFLHGERRRYGAAKGPSAAPVAPARRWPLAGQQPSFTDSTSGYTGQAGVGRELRRRVIRMALGTLTLTVVLFFTLPRWGRQPWRGAAAATRQIVGFLDSVSLLEPAGSSIVENPEEVLRIRFFDHATEEPYRVSGQLYLHGAVLTHYREGTWSDQPPDSDSEIRFLKVTRPESVEGLVRQRIEIEPMGREELFYVWPFFNMRKDQSLLFDPARGSLFRRPSERNKRFVYELGTTAFEYGFQRPLVPVSARSPVDTEPLPDPPPIEGEGAMPGLAALAERWVRDAGLDEDDHFACARRLERELRDSGRFQYSLVGQSRDPSIDPVEDFVTKNPRGHCEYFATALALMLRSRGIPSRLVVGYKTDEWNRPGRFFQVRQLHTHTWVEAYLEPSRIPAPLAFDDRRSAAISGAWLRLDPTPAAPSPQDGGLLDAVLGAFDWLDLAWANYVVEMDRSRQQEAIYNPVSDVLAEAGRRMTDSNWWRTSFGRLGATLRNGLGNPLGGRWFSWRGGLVAMGVALVVILAFRGLRVGLRRLMLRLAARVNAAGRRARTRVEFYRRLEALLARSGLRRAAWQTQREFAREAGAKIAASTGQAHLADLPIQVAEAFYRVRFGGMPLDNTQAETVEQTLKQLKQAVGGGRRTATAGSAG